ncbi:MAG: SDR family NAD(P)-dependent oxidoreductase [Beutenbergiaceae bacterium]
MTDAQIFEGRTAVVTGGARGLGYAMATALANHGADIVLVDLLDRVAESASSLASQTGRQVGYQQVDVTDAVAVDVAFEAISAAGRTPTILVNAAGISAGSSALEITPQEWRKIFDVNVNGTFLPSQAFARRVVAQEMDATVVNISSMSGFIVNVPQTQAAYNTSKAAVSMMTQSLAIEWLPYGIRVNAIGPGYFASDMTRDFVRDHPEMTKDWISRIPMGRMGEPAELGDLVVYLASERSSYVVGQTFMIDGGYTLV